ncbi:MAG: YdcF family protein [Rhodospirillales bacterium]
MRLNRRLRFGKAPLAVGIGVVAAVIWLMGLLNFADNIPRRVADLDRETDAIVVLTGGSERLATGLRLLAEDRAKRMFVSGVHPGVDVERLLQLAGRSDDGLHGRIEIGYGARDTRGNAQETAAWMREHGYRSLRLVTGGYHMPRSLLEFSEALPEAEVVPHPVFPDRVKQTSWWMRPGTAALIIGEYNKYLLARLEHSWRELMTAMTPGYGR